MYCDLVEISSKFILGYSLKSNFIRTIPWISIMTLCRMPVARKTDKTRIKKIYKTDYIIRSTILTVIANR